MTVQELQKHVLHTQLISVVSSSDTMAVPSKPADIACRKLCAPTTTSDLMSHWVGMSDNRQVAPEGSCQNRS